MKNSSRNGIIFFLVLIFAIIGYSIIHVYCKSLKNDISSGGVVYENNRKKQPVNNIVTVKKYNPHTPATPTPTSSIEPTIEPTVEPTITPTVNPTTKPTSTPKPTPTHHEEVGRNIFFEYDYDDGNYIYLVDQFPIADEVGKSLQGNKKTNDFKLRFNTDATGVKYTITIEKLDGSTLDDEWVKVFLVNDGIDVLNCYRANNRIKSYNEYSKYNNKNNERIIYEGIISSAEASRGYKDFTFRMWVSEDLKVENSNYLSESRTYRTRINVYAQE